jgi:hypothetical protein
MDTYALNKVKWLVIVTERECVYCTVGKWRWSSLQVNLNPSRFKEIHDLLYFISIHLQRSSLLQIYECQIEYSVNNNLVSDIFHLLIFCRDVKRFRNQTIPSSGERLVWLLLQKGWRKGLISIPDIQKRSWSVLLTFCHRVQNRHLFHWQMSLCGWQRAW